MSDEELLKYIGKDIITCPTCGKVYELREFEKLEPIKNILVDIAETRKCDECGTEFGYMFRRKIAGADKKNTISIQMDMDLYHLKD